jgi:hypothetical protein
MRFAVCIIALMSVLASCGPQPKSAAAPEAKTAAAAPFDTNIPLDEVMAHVMDPAAYAFWGGTGTSYTADGDTDLSPKTEAEWKKVEDGAAMVVLGANSLMLRGYAREPMADWDRYAAKVAEVAERAKAAVERKDTAAMRSIGDELDAACEACHTQFSPAAPATAAEAASQPGAAAPGSAGK